MQWISIEDLLADQGTLTDDPSIHLIELEDESRLEPEPEASQIEMGAEALDNRGQVNIADLDLLAEMICDRILPLLDIEQERNGISKSLSFMRQAESPSQRNCWQLKPGSLALLTQEMAHRLHRQLELEQERQGFRCGCLPW